MIMGFSAHGTNLTGRLAAAQRVNNLPVTGMPCQERTGRDATEALHASDAKRLLACVCCRCNDESHCCETLESCVSCCLAPDHNASVIYSQDYRSPGR